MQSAPQLWEQYEQWKRLTIAEGAAISSSDWVEVRRCQSEKKALQDKIIGLTEFAKAECSNPTQKEEFESRIRSYVNELILLETGNNDTLQKRLQNLARERSDLDRAASRLRKVHKSYVPPRDAVWDRYS